MQQAPDRRHDRDPHCQRLVHVGCSAKVASTDRASLLWRVASSCEEYTCRTTPVLSITYVTRPGRRPSVRSTPYSARTVLSRSDSSRNGSAWRSMNRRCDFTESELTPRTSAPWAVNSSYLSRNARASRTQPGVSSLG